MINLSKHIEILLLEHDCVIIPKLGGFIANQVEAHYGDNDSNFFIPPHRSVGFNKNLLINDGLLVQSYMQVYDASYPDAYKQMEMDIDEVLQLLDLNGTFLFEGVGIVRKNVDGNITFEPSKEGVLTPELYGLHPLDIKSAAEVRKEKELINTIQNTNVLPIQSGEHLSSTYISKEKDSEDEDVTIRLHRRWFDVSIAAVVAVLLFFLFSYPSFRNTSPSDTCVAGSLYVNKKDMKEVSPISQDKPASDSKENLTKKEVQETESSEEAVLQEASNAETTNESVQNINEDTNGEVYVLVLASYVSKANAKTFIENLNSEGYNNAEYLKTGKVSRIVYSGYSSKDEAADSLSILRKQHAAFKDAWILKI